MDRETPPQTLPPSTPLASRSRLRRLGAFGVSISAHRLSLVDPRGKIQQIRHCLLGYAVCRLSFSAHILETNVAYSERAWREHAAYSLCQYALLIRLRLGYVFWLLMKAFLFVSEQVLRSSQWEWLGCQHELHMPQSRITTQLRCAWLLL